ncbi:MAG: hypothetical protein IJJ82_07260 [Clostridia bacterium]|nr:hypothetical protein [Clostridia bacterium]
MKMNCLYVKRDETGNPVLYGAHKDGSTMTVYLSTKDADDLCTKVYNPAVFPTATAERIRKALKDRPTHDFVGNIGASVLTMPADWSKMTLNFV